MCQNFWASAFFCQSLCRFKMGPIWSAEQCVWGVESLAKVTADVPGRTSQALNLLCLQRCELEPGAWRMPSWPAAGPWTGVAAQPGRRPCGSQHCHCTPEDKRTSCGAHLVEYHSRGCRGRRYDKRLSSRQTSVYTLPVWCILVHEPLKPEA